MNEPLAVWIVGLLLVTWNLLLLWSKTRKQIDALERNVALALSKGYARLRAKNINVSYLNDLADRHAHHFEIGTPIFEMYFLTVVFLGFFLFRTFYDIVVYDWISYDFLRDQARIQENLERVKFRNESSTMTSLSRELEIPRWMSGLAMAAPIFGMVAFVIMVIHVGVYVLKCKEEKLAAEKNAANSEADINMLDRRATVLSTKKCGVITQFDPSDELVYKMTLDDGEQNWFKAESISIILEDVNPWRVGHREDLVLLVILMPGIFIFMAMRAEIRVLQVMTCSTFRSGEVWEDFEPLLMGTYSADLDCAAGFQYLVVYAFARLCASCFSLERMSKYVELQLAKLTNQVKELEKQVQELKAEAQSSHLNMGSQNSTAVKAAVELQKQLVKASEEHTSGLQRAGLLGVWFFICVGIVRSIIGIGAAVESEFYGGSGVFSRNEGLAKLICVVATALCIVNMILILKMADIRHPAALGEKAALKFMAARVLLMIGDGQPVAIITMSHLFGWGFSSYQAKLLHVSLLMLECLGVVIFNFFAWSQKVYTQLEYNNQNHEQEAESGTAGRGWRLLTVVREMPLLVLHTVVAPSALLVVAVVMGYPPNGVQEPRPTSKGAMFLLDTVFRTVGPLLPFLLLAAHHWHLPMQRLIDSNRLSAEHGISYLPSNWLAALAILWLLMLTARLSGFIVAKPLNHYFSDHIFLITCVASMLQMQLVIAHGAWPGKSGTWKDKAAASAIIAAAWLLLLFLFVEAFQTTRYYHTQGAVWAAMVAGLLLFHSVFLLPWLRAVGAGVLGQMKAREPLL
mmetsp:Transcript_57056/g.123488  ORF Transcript_57056/g.123488 Transcript_57056/m.123488 type:complete len:800 (+) Transcript_57056:53-2452(+)